MDYRRDDTIAALATAPGVGAVAIVRISGKHASDIARSITRRELEPRLAALRTFRDADGVLIDRGIAIFFPAPHSFTGEDVVELQAHGGHAVTDALLAAAYALGARAAEPGEFSLRAFLNDRIDLLQAEAIADLIASGSRQAAQAALRSLDGQFSSAVHTLQAALTALRVRIEAWLDFPEEELPFDAAPEYRAELERLATQIQALVARAREGRALRDGLSVAIAGPPNAGKSSLLNQLAGYDAAIVTDVPGTTRDPLREQLSLDGMPVTIVDTAGLRDTADRVEREGVRRTNAEVARADHVLWIADAREPDETAIRSAREALAAGVPFTIVANKIDLVDMPDEERSVEGIAIISLSALTGAGLERLVAHLKKIVGYPTEIAGTFSARRRHLDALARVQTHLAAAGSALAQHLELTAEHLRDAQTALGELTGELTSDDLLGEIFSTFCIGK